jgi:hypothetical protein
MEKRTLEVLPVVSEDTGEPVVINFREGTKFRLEMKQKEILVNRHQVQWSNFQLQIRMRLSTKIPEFALPITYEIVAVLFFVVFGMINLLHKIVAELTHVSFGAVVLLRANNFSIIVLL